jgi:hypothetical protein
MGESEGGKNTDKKIVMIKLIIQKEKKKNTIFSNNKMFSYLVKVLELFLWGQILVLALGILGFVARVLALLSDS